MEFVHEMNWLARQELLLVSKVVLRSMTACRPVIHESLPLVNVLCIREQSSESQRLVIPWQRPSLRTFVETVAPLNMATYR